VGASNDGGGFDLLDPVVEDCSGFRGVGADFRFFSLGTIVFHVELMPKAMAV
jgi:hypothetical protein